MYQFAYSETQRDSVVDAKARERALLQRCIDMLQRIRSGDNPAMARMEAAHFVTRVWTALIEDLAMPRNELPDEVKAGLISVGLWILREAEAMRLGQSDNVEGVCEIIGIVRDSVSP